MPNSKNLVRFAIPRDLKDKLKVSATAHGFRTVHQMIGHMYDSYEISRKIKTTADYKQIVQHLNDEEKNKIVENVSKINDKTDDIIENIQILGQNQEYFNKKILEILDNLGNLSANNKPKDLNISEDSEDSSLNLHEE